MYNAGHGGRATKEIKMKDYAIEVGIDANYKGKDVKVVRADRGGDWLTFALGAETFGPNFLPTERGIEFAKDWLRHTGHTVK